jgi:hypothetical protein
MTFTETPSIVILVAIFCAVAMTVVGSDEYKQRKLKSNLLETAQGLKLTDTCNSFGAIVHPNKPNCVAIGQSRFVRTDTFIGFFAINTEGKPHPVWTISDDPLVDKTHVPPTDLRAFHDAFVER